MNVWSYKCVIAFAYWSVFTGSEGVTALQQIFHSSYAQFNTYPIINAVEHLPNMVIDDCKDFFRQNLTLDGICPNGTNPHCVENNSPPMKEFLFICTPTSTCDENARSIVYVDRRSPDMYFLGKKSCKGGYLHTKDGDCFAPCNVWDGRIQIYKKSTSSSRATVYCNYEYRYCNPFKPKLFELTRESNVCSLRLDKVCPAGMDRLSDCTCDAKCKEGFRRDPADDFKCKKDANYPVMNQESSKESNTLLQISNFTAHAQYTGLRVSWCIVHAENTYLLLKHIEVSYKAVNNVTVNDLPTVPHEDDCQDVVIEHLFPGKKYILFVKFVYEHNGQNVSDTRRTYGKTKPKSVKDLNATFSGTILSAEWLPPNDSIFDKYVIVIRNQRKEWRELEMYETSYFEQLTDAIPGEKYEVTVYTVSNNVKSDKKMKFLNYPPLPPRKIYCSFLPGGDQGTDRHVFWFNNDKLSYVDGYYVSYSSTTTGDSKLDVYLPISHSQEEVSYDMRNLHLGQTYTVMVKSQIEGVNSTAPTQIIISIPCYDDDNNDIIIPVLILVVVVLLYIIYGGKNEEIKQNLQGEIYRITKNRRSVSGNVIKIKAGKNANIYHTDLTGNNHSNPIVDSSASSEEEA
ncbi:uncharacterized protein LOC128556252 [Mercenaria mercenaria]|uniref:uncharacterized protein LOC128556252 n=1 Tax=Mercenaria mercenaria TaxID=6596 RepID=UPI00234F2372|nr:uncharacterized protein LOC128556252 [Mercenaria mercenaria]XP_053396694.1 uncharacterized protein LOC128556252 [Mercenaria mercenaria]